MLGARFNSMAVIFISQVLAVLVRYRQLTMTSASGFSLPEILLKPGTLRVWILRSIDGVGRGLPDDML